MKLTLDWDEETVDLVMIAVDSYLSEVQETVSHMRRFNPSGQLLARGESSAAKLTRALNDLGLEAYTEDDPADGIYPVKELLGSHEVRLLKEGS